MTSSPSPPLPDSDEWVEFDDEMVRGFLCRRDREVLPRTVSKDLTVMRRYTDFLGNTWVEDAAYRDVVAFVDSLVDAEHPKSTVRSYMSSVSQLHEYLGHFHRIGMPTVSGIIHHYSDDRFADGVERKPIPGVDVEALIREPDNVRDTLVNGLLYASGSRASAAADVKLHEIDAEEAVFKITGAKGNGDRTLPIHDQLLRLVRVWQDDKRQLYPAADASEYFFVGDESEKLSGQDVWEIVHESAESAGIQDTIGHRANGNKVYRVKPHVLRHSFATHAFHQGMSLDELAAFLGHDNKSTTKGYIYDYENKRNQEAYGLNLFTPSTSL